MPDSFNVDNILTNDVLFPAWNIDKKIPVFFSKKTSQLYKNTEPMYSVSMSDMVWASATNPNFFSAANIKWPGNEKGNLFFGGDTVSSCPALYSHFLATNTAFWGIDPAKIKMITVGNKDFSSDKISSSVSVLDWVSRLYQLTGPVKKYTQNYMVEHILRKNNIAWNYYQLPQSSDFSFFEMVSNDRDINTIKQNADEMIN